MEVSESTKRALAFRSGNICAKCHKELTVDYSGGMVKVIGECAHIEGEHGGNSATHKPPAARYNPSMTDQERNSFPNLIYLCSNCHAEIDKIPEGEQDFPVCVLREMKNNHETTIRKRMVDAFPEVGFHELAEVTKWVSTVSPTYPTSDFSLLNVEAKMRRNDLSEDNLVIMKTGLAVAHEIKSYIDIVSKTDYRFPEKLRDGFLRFYYTFRHEGARGDELFESMCQLAQRGFETQKLKTAGLAVLVYMFEACEVFEK